MKKTLLIVNTASGSAGSVDEEQLALALADAGLKVVGTVRLPEDDLPKRNNVAALSVDIIAIFSGDGTIASLCKEMAGWDGGILVLPGGTMNLLSRHLHGDRPAAEILERMAARGTAVSTVPVIDVGGTTVFTGLIAGPSTQWGKVRESLRKLDIGEIVEKVPEAWAATTTGDSVRIAGLEGGYPAIFVEPLDNGNLGVRAFRADGLGDMLGHGIAWLHRDFRDGPHDDLGEMRSVTIIDNSDARLGLLVDGEHDEARSPLKCVPTKSSVRFLRVAA